MPRTKIEYRRRYLAQALNNSDRITDRIDTLAGSFDKIPTQIKYKLQEIKTLNHTIELLINEIKTTIG